MLGKRSAQGYLFSPEQRLRHKIGEESFYAVLVDHRHELFHDEDFAMLHCSDNGRSGVPPSLLAVALLLQTFHTVSDQEAPIVQSSINAGSLLRVSVMTKCRYTVPVSQPTHHSQRCQVHFPKRDRVSP